MRIIEILNSLEENRNKLRSFQVELVDTGIKFSLAKRFKESEEPELNSFLRSTLSAGFEGLNLKFSAGE